MGFIRNHAIVVTASYGNYIEEAHAKAREIFGTNISEITPEVVNGSRSFLIPPDGSKEGWPESTNGDIRRSEFKDWLRAQAFSDGSSPLEWVEVYYGSDDNGAAIEDDGMKLYRDMNAKEESK